METPRTQSLQKVGAFVTADEVAKDIQRVVRNHPEELEVENEQSLGQIKFPPFFLGVLGVSLFRRQARDKALKLGLMGR